MIAAVNYTGAAPIDVVLVKCDRYLRVRITTPQKPDIHTRIWGNGRELREAAWQYSRQSVDPVSPGGGSEPGMRVNHVTLPLLHPSTTATLKAGAKGVLWGTPTLRLKRYCDTWIGAPTKSCNPHAAQAGPFVVCTDKYDIPASLYLPLGYPLLFKNLVSCQ